MTNIEGQTICRAHPEVVEADLGNETVLLHLEKGVYYGLRGAGPAIWAKLEDPVTVEERRAELLDAYEVTESRCRVELEAFLRKLYEHDLVELQN